MAYITPLDPAFGYWQASQRSRATHACPRPRRSKARGGGSRGRVAAIGDAAVKSGGRCRTEKTSTRRQRESTLRRADGGNDATDSGGDERGAFDVVVGAGTRRGASIETSRLAFGCLRSRSGSEQGL